MRPDPVPLSRAQRLALTTASFLLLSIATMALGPLISGSGWWWLCAFIAAGTLFSGFGLRAIRTPPSLVPVLELVVLLLMLTLLFGGASSFALIVPTASTFDTFGELLVGAQRTIEQQSVPAIPVPPLSFALALGVGLLAVVTDILVQTVRMPALAAAPALVPILIPGFIIEAGAELPTLVLTAAAYLLLLRIDVRVRRRARLAAGDEGDQAATVIAPKRVPIVSTLGASLGLAAVGLLAASVLAASTPSISTSLLLGSPSQGTLFARGVSPFIDLGRDLRRPEPMPAFHYLARDGDRPYFTLLTLDRFEGEVWGATDRAVDGDNTVDALPRPDGLSSRVQTSEHPIDVVVDEVRTTWLPVPYPTTSIEGLEGSWFWEDSSLTVRSVDTNTGGQRYRVNRLDVEPTPQQLRDANPDAPEELAPFLALPEELPAIITDTAASVTSGAASQYDAAVAIQAYLRGVDFDYSTEAPVEEGYDGGGFDVIAQFLETKAGYCVHFASTMAVLARQVGIPSRISIGYTQGSPDGRAGRWRAARRGRLARPALVARAVLPGRGLGAVRADAGPRHGARLLPPERGRGAGPEPPGRRDLDAGRERPSRARPRPRARRIPGRRDGGRRAAVGARGSRGAHRGAPAAPARRVPREPAAHPARTGAAGRAGGGCRVGRARRHGARPRRGRRRRGDRTRVRGRDRRARRVRERRDRPRGTAAPPRRRRARALRARRRRDRPGARRRPRHRARGAPRRRPRTRAGEGRARAALAVRPGAQGARRPARRRGVESSIVATQHSPFRVNVRDLVNRPGVMREQHLAIAVADPMGEGLVSVKEGSELDLDVRLESVHEGVLVTAEVDALAEGECGRCLIDIALPVEVEFQELFAYHSGEAFEYEVQDDHVDLESLIRDAVVLSLPFQPVCRPDCPGLDPETGVRLADHPELVTHEQRDPRWAALAGFEASEDQGADVASGADQQRD